MGDEEIDKDLSTKKDDARHRAKQHLIEAVHALGLPAESAEDAWGRLVGVQARIALDEGGGSKATAAAKLVAQATGLIDEEEVAAGKAAWTQLTMDETGAAVLLGLVQQERARRAAQEELDDE